MHVAAAAYKSESSKSSDKYIVITRLLNAVCTEIVDKCVNSICDSTPPATEPATSTECINSDNKINSARAEPVHDNLLAVFNTTQEVNPEINLDEIHTRRMDVCVQPNEHHKTGAGKSFPTSLGVFGSKHPGISSLLAPATCNHQGSFSVQGVASKWWGFLSSR